jgi:hypothetical protein
LKTALGLLNNKKTANSEAKLNQPAPTQPATKPQTANSNQQSINPQQTEQAKQNQITAGKVGEALKAAGFPISLPITDISRAIDDKERKGGLVSKVATATDVADVFIDVYETPDARNKARIEMVAACPGCAYIAECGIIMVYLPTISTNQKAKNYSRQAYEILKKQYQCE